jgi:hypothetical protein
MKVENTLFCSTLMSFCRWMRKLIFVLTILLAVSCTTQPAEEETIEVRFRDTVADPKAVSVVLPLVATSHEPDESHLSPAHQSLFTYLAQTEPAALVTTKPHSQGKWRIEKVFLLDDCVAVQMTEGHYLETLFFVQYRNGWRLKSRITPRDHE